MPPREYCSIIESHGWPCSGQHRSVTRGSRPPSPATFADTNVRDVNCSREERPRRRTTVDDVLSNKEQHALHLKIHIPTENPRMYPGCPLTTADTAQQANFDHPHKQHVNRSPYQKQFFGPDTKPGRFRPPARISSQFRSPV